MKYYIINADGKEIIFDIESNNYNQNGIIGFDVITATNEIKKYFVRTLAGKNYISEDNKTWRKSPAISNLSGLVNVNESLKVYRGFKPSGLSNANAGALVTDMPGKIVKILTAQGAVVNQGDTLLILEAMKMENEIKAGIDGVIKAIHVSEGQTIESGQIMIEIEE